MAIGWASEQDEDLLSGAHYVYYVLVVFERTAKLAFIVLDDVCVVAVECSDILKQLAAKVRAQLIGLLRVELECNDECQDYW